MNIPKAFIVLLLAQSVFSDGRHESKHASEITGSWDVTISFTRPPDFPTVKALYTFAEGGAFVMTANNADTRIIGPGHGTWTRTAEQEFGLTFIRMRFDPTTTPPSWIGTFKGRWSALHLSDSGDEWTSARWTLDYYD